MQKRFLEQRAAIVATFLDERLKNQRDAKGLHADLSDGAIKSVEEYVAVMSHMYQATLMISSEKHPSCGLILPLLVSYHAQYLCSTSLQHVAEHSLEVIFSASVYILQCCSFLQNSILYMIACLVTWKFVLLNLFRPNSSPSLHPMTMMVATLQRWRQQCQQIWRSATRGKPSNTSLKRPQPWTPGWSRKTASHHRHGSAWLLQWQNIWYIFFWLLILDANVTIITQVFLSN